MFCCFWGLFYNGRIRASAQPERVRRAASRVRARKRGGVVLCGTSRERGENISVNDFFSGGGMTPRSLSQRGRKPLAVDTKTTVRMSRVVVILYFTSIIGFASGVSRAHRTVDHHFNRCNTVVLQKVGLSIRNKDMYISKYTQIFHRKNSFRAPKHATCQKSDRY